MSTAQVTSVFTARESMVRTLRNIEGAATRLDRTFGSLRGRIRTAFEFHVVNRALNTLERGLYRITHAIPDLIARGERWAATVDAISDATGLSAEQASELAAIQQRVGGNADSLTRGFLALSKSVYQNRDAWKDMGVQVALNRDGSVDAYETFQNLRRAISATGGSLLSTNAAQTALGRGGKDLLDILQLNDRQFRILARDARAAGQVMTAAGAAAAEAFARARARFDATLDGLGTRLLEGLAPVLTRFVDGFTSFLQRNMDAIVRFVVGGANTILTVVGDLLGIDLGTWSFTEQVGQLGNDAERTSQKLRDLGREQDRTGQSARRAADATSSQRRETQRLRNELGLAYRELYRIQQRTTFRGDMNNVEIELWRQRKMAEVKAAQERVDQARKALSDHRRTMNTMADVTRAASVRMRKDLGDVWKPPKKSGTGAGGGLFGDTTSIIAESTRLGHQISDAIKDAIFGEDQQRTIVSGGLAFEVTTRSGGLIDKLGELTRFLGTVGTHLTNLNGLLGGNGPLVLGLAALLKVLPLSGGTSSGGGWAGPAAVAIMIREGINRFADENLPGKDTPMDVPNLGLGSTLGTIGLEPQIQARIVQAGIDAVTKPAGDALAGWIKSMLPGTAQPGVPGSSMPVMLQWLQDKFGVGGVEVGTTGAAAPGALAPGAGLASLFRRYWGESSPVIRTGEDQLGSLSALYGTGTQTAENTAPLGAGNLGVTNPNFPDIGQVQAWRAGDLGVEGRGGIFRVDNASGTYLGIWPTGGKKLPVQAETNLPLSTRTNIEYIRRYGAESRASLANIAPNIRTMVTLLGDIKRNTASSGTRSAATSSLRPSA